MHRRDGKLIVSATDLVGFLECGHLTQLDRAAVAGLIRKPDRADDPEVELLRRRGGQHEQRYIEQLRAEGRSITDLSGHDDDSYADKAARTLEAMRRGDDVIYQGMVFDGQWLGYPDFLLRVSTKNREDVSPVNGTLGTDWHYEVADTKLAHSAKASALIQMCSYVDLITDIQGTRPEWVYVVTSGAQIELHPFRTAEMMAYYRHAKRRFEDALDEEKVGPRTWPIPREESYPDPVEHCAVCRWFPHNCRVQWRDDDALPLVAGVSRTQRKSLIEQGIRTRGALATATVDKKLERVREQARLQVASDGLPIPVHELLPPERDSAGSLVADRGLSALPEPSVGDLFFDIEGDPFAFWEGLEYLFGIWERGSGDTIWDQGSYRGLWAMDRVQEKQQFERVVDLFVERWKQFPDMHVYHYGVYEPSRLKVLAGRHATREEELDQLLRNRVFVDLYRVVRQGVRVGAERYSIKNLEPLYGYHREIELRDANSSIVEFEKVLEIGDPDGELRRKIELYNRDDCVSTQWLRDWLEIQRGRAVETWGALPRPPVAIDEQPREKLSDWLRRVSEMTDRLTGPIPDVAADQTADDKATWLVAHLVDWHRREDKSTWWRYYDLLSKTDDELFQEAEPIGRMEFVDRSDPGGRSRSFVYRYRFPSQEHKVELGYVDDPQIEGKNKSTGEVVAIDEDAGTIDIRRPKTWDGPHPRSVIQVIHYDAADQREALMRLGDWVATNGISAESGVWRAARDLLLRRSPRIVGQAGGSLALPGESGSDAARRLATQLDGTTLAIQGPPGSGKTYIGARMIVDLVRAGRRVGITSNGHKVICNLVEAVLKAAREAGETVRVIQKGKEDEVFHDPWVKRADKDGEVADGLAAGVFDIGAGTPWLWAGENLANSVETLFVDEAGQVSLANVVAVSGAGRNLVLLGDPQQLDQPTQGVHPDGAGVSALTHLLDGLETVPADRGLFLERTWRMHPAITAYTSEVFYEGKLESVAGLERQAVLGSGWLAGSGLRWVPVEHDGNKNESVEEADRVSAIWKELVGREWRDWEGRTRVIGPQDIVIVSPFNAHRLLIQERLGPSARVGTVDKFQGQEAPVSIYTMATSRPEDAPRGLGFLYSLNRLNVATSRARALAIVVASPLLLAVIPHSPEQLRMANGLCAFVEIGLRAGSEAAGSELVAVEGGPQPVNV